MAVNISAIRNTPVGGGRLGHFFSCRNASSCNFAIVAFPSSAKTHTTFNFASRVPFKFKNAYNLQYYSSAVKFKCNISITVTYIRELEYVHTKFNYFTIRSEENINNQVIANECGKFAIYQ